MTDSKTIPPISADLPRNSTFTPSKDTYDAAIPDAMKAVPGFVAVMLLLPKERGSKPRKLGLSIHVEGKKGLRAVSPAQPEQHMTYSEAIRFLSRQRIIGLGFCFNSSGLFCIDLDKCRNSTTGEIAEWAETIIAPYAGKSYIEISYSRTGVHIIGIGEKPGTICERPMPNGGKIEIYDNARLLHLTGDVLCL